MGLVKKSTIRKKNLLKILKEKSKIIINDVKLFENITNNFCYIEQSIKRQLIHSKKFRNAHYIRIKEILCLQFFTLN
jgi:hypothetical protein